jgi:ABC-2 type transport system ATP-binding protein
MKNDIVIKVENLTKRYGEILAVDHISFEVKEGEVFGAQTFHFPGNKVAF